MSELVAISKARARLSELVRRSADEDVVLMNHSTPAAVIVSADRYESLLDELEEAVAHRHEPRLLAGRAAAVLEIESDGHGHALTRPEI